MYINCIFVLMGITEQELKEFTEILKNYTSYDFSNYSVKSLTRRVNKVIDDNKLNFTGLVYKIKNNKEFVEKVIKDITVNTTELFRDPESWNCIKYKILPELSKKQSINIWHAGCSTGQEVYSMLMLLSELNLFNKANVYASDINRDVLEFAKKGVYRFRFNLNYLDNYNEVLCKNPFNFEDIKDVPYEKYFSIDKKNDIIIMNPELRQKIRWSFGDLVKKENPFYVKYDLILCRNVLIYFDNDLQSKTIELFSENLLSKSYLVIGAHESIIGKGEMYFSRKNKYYIKK